MDIHEHAATSAFARLAEESIGTVRRWLGTADVPVPAAEARLARVVGTPRGADLATDIVNGVLRPREARAISRNLELLSHGLPPGSRQGIEFDTHISAGLASLSAGVATGVVRDRFFRLFSHLLLRLDVRGLDDHLADLRRRGGIRPTLAPVAGPASGRHEADRQVADVRDLLLRPDVDSVSFRVSSVCASWRLVDLDALVDEVTNRVAPLFDAASGAQGPKHIDLEVGVFDELEPTLRVFERMLKRYPQLDVGIALPDYFPDSLPALRRVSAAARQRHAGGGTTATVRITRGEFRTQEAAVAEAHGWTPAVFPSPEEAHAQYLRMLDFALHPAHTAFLRVISATHDVFTTAFAWRLARLRGVERSLEHEFRLGVATREADVVKRDVGGVRIHAPVMHAGQLPLATPSLVRRIEELSGPEAHLFAPTTPAALDAAFAHEERRFLAALDGSRQTIVASMRHQNLVRTEVADFTNPATREWAQGVRERARDSAAGEAVLARSAVDSIPALDALVSGAIGPGQSWGERRGSTRAAVLESVAEVLAEWRGLLAEVAVSESGVPIEEADADVTTAIQFAVTAAANARELDELAGAKYVPPRLIVVVSPRSCAVSSLAATVLAGLAAGGAVIVKTAPETRRTTAVFLETLVAGGVPPNLVSMVESEGDVAQALITDQRVDRVVHAGSRHVAKLFHSWRAELPLISATGGRNSVIVTQSADLEATVADVVSSALDHGGQAPTATGTVILVGSVGSSARFLGRLADAVASIPTDRARGRHAGIASLARPAGEREREALDELADGETWLVRPRKLDADGAFWSPGIRDGVRADSLVRRQERRAPVLDIVRVPTLADAIDAQNAPEFGLSAGIFSLDADEVEFWLDSVQAGLACINRPVVSSLGARVPVGGWDRSILGTGTAAGGQDAAIVLGTWEPVAEAQGLTVTLDGIGERAARLIAAAQSGMTFAEFDWVRAGARRDENAWTSAFATKESASSGFERNVQRYRPVPVTIRLSEGVPVAQLVRVLAAAAITGAPVAVSSAVPLHPGLIAAFGEPDSPVDVAEVLVESDIRWRARVQAREIVTNRIRLIGGDSDVLARVLHGQPGIAVHAGPVTTSGRIELLAFLREQSICIGLSSAELSASSLRRIRIR